MKHYFLFIVFGIVLGCNQPDIADKMNKIQDINRAIVSISIEKMPDKTVYEIGETEYDLTGIKVLGWRPNGVAFELEQDSLELEGFNTASLGRKTFVLVSHRGIGGNPIRTNIRFIIVKENGTRGEWGITQFEGGSFRFNGLTVESIGAASANVARANTGAPVDVLVEPENGFMFVEGSLKYKRAGGGEEPNTGITILKDEQDEYAFMMPPYNIVLEAEFTRIEHTVASSPALRADTLILKNMETGAEDVSVSARLGDRVQVNIQPEYAALLNPSSLTYTYFDARLGKETGPRIDTDLGMNDITGGIFLMPHGNTSIHGTYLGSQGLFAIDIDYNTTDDNNTPLVLTYNIGATELDFTNFAFTKIYDDQHREMVRYRSEGQTGGQWEISLNGGATWGPYIFNNPNQSFSGFDGKIPFDNTRLGTQPVVLKIEGKAAPPFNIIIRNEDNTAAAYRTDQSGGSVIDRYYRTLHEAVEAACPAVVGITWGTANQEVIHLLKDIAFNGDSGVGITSPAISLAAGKHIEIWGGYDGNGTMSRAVSGFGSLFTVNTGSSLSLSGRLVVDGGQADTPAKEATGALVHVNGGTFKMKGADVILKNNYDSYHIAGTSDQRGGAVLVSGGSFIMEGGKIIDSKSSYSNSNVCLKGDGQFSMSGGMIENVSAGNQGVHLSGTCTFTMSGSATIHIKNPVNDSGTRKIHLAGTLNPQSYSYGGITISRIAARLLNFSANTQYLAGDIAQNKHLFRPQIFGDNGEPQPRFTVDPTDTTVFHALTFHALTDNETGVDGITAVVETHTFTSTQYSSYQNFPTPITGGSILLQGGGGGGGGGGSLYGGTGGSAGQVVRIDNHVLYGRYELYVGTGGAGGTSVSTGASTPGNTGGSTYIIFPDDSVHNASGGAGGASKSTGSYGGDGGNGFNVTTEPYLPVSGTAAAGANGGSGSGTNNTFYSAGGGGGGSGAGVSSGGAGGSGGGSGGPHTVQGVQNGDGHDASAFGCGGGGGAGNSNDQYRGNGGSGGAGRIVIEFVLYANP